MNWVGVHKDYERKFRKQLCCIQCKKIIYISFKQKGVINIKIFKILHFRFLPEKMHQQIILILKYRANEDY